MVVEKECSFYDCQNPAIEGSENNLCDVHAQKEWYSVPEAAKIWSAGERSVRDWINPRHIVYAERNGKRPYLIPVEEFTKPHPASRPRTAETEYMVTVKPRSLRQRLLRPAVIAVALLIIITATVSALILMTISSSPEPELASSDEATGVFIGDTPLSVEFDSWSPSEPILVMVEHPAALEVEFTNTGEVAGDFFAAVSLRDPDGIWVDIRPLIPVHLEAGQKGDASWEYSPGRKGAWDVVYGIWSKWEDGLEPEGPIGNTGILEDHIVAYRQCIERASTPRRVRIESYWPFNPEELKVGEAATLGLSIANTGDEARIFSVGATVWYIGESEKIDGNYREDMDTPIKPDQSATFEWKHPLASPGSYQVMFTVWDSDGKTVMLKAPCPRETLISAYSPSAPKIIGMEPAKPRTSAARQWIAFEGENFMEQSSVILSIMGNSYPISEERTEFVDSESLRAYAGLTDPGTWSAVVVNPGDENSNLFEFNVLP